MPKNPIYVCGPTASGKTALALALAESLNGEIVNGDAFQVYRGIEILSAAPGAEEKSRCPHHLFGICDLEESMDGAKFEGLARPVIDDILSREKVPVIVGGSGLYLKFLTHGIAPSPGADQEIRSSLDQLSVEEIYRQLEELDPDEAARQNSKNRRHLSRALEICLVTGQKASELRKNFEDPRKTEGLDGVFLHWPRDLLSDRIALRTRWTLANGAIEEVENLPEETQTAQQAIGVKEIRAYLLGDFTLDECAERLTISTRQYAKRQRNWFQREDWLRSIDGCLSIEEQVRASLEKL